MNLPLDISNFFHWWLVKTPKRLIEISRNALILANNKTSFLLDLKMFFVPLFGDYTWIGRVMGLIYRVVKIAFGFIALSLVIAVLAVVNLSWYVIPLALIYYLNLLFIPLIVLFYAFWKITHLNYAEFTTSQVDEDNFIKALKPMATYYSSMFKHSGKDALPRFFEEANIKALLVHLELEGTDFIRNLHSHISSDLSMVGEKAFGTAKNQGTRYVELEHLFLVLVQSVKRPGVFLSSYSLTTETCSDAVKWLVGHRDWKASLRFWQEGYEPLSMGGVNRGMTGRVTPLLDRSSLDFTEQATNKNFKAVIGREEEIEEISNILSGSGKRNVLIIGEPGCGKTAIVRGIAQEIIKGTKFKDLEFKRVIQVDAGSLISGTKAAGDLSEKLEKMMEEVEGSGNIILFLDEIHNLVLANEGDSSSNIFTILETYLASGKFEVIGATNLKNYREHIEPNGSFARLFRTVKIDEASPEDTLEILKKIAFDLQKERKVKISYPSLLKTVSLTKKLLHERVLPDKAIDVLSRTVVKFATHRKSIKTEDIAEVVSNLTNVPVTTIQEDEAQKLLNIEKEMRGFVIGQNQAIDQIGKALKRARVGIRDEGKPIASFMFVGTTGVGKTETAKTLAKLYFGEEAAMVRLDMSEYQQQDSINRLLGSPDGKTKGLLTDAVRTAPFTLILLDEIEKAYSQVLLTFLQVLDDGRLTDSSGQTVDFTNTIIIATSNVGTRSLQEAVEENKPFEKMKEVAMRDVRNHFAPEFLNRFNGIIVFKPLEIASVRKIARLMLNRVEKMADAKGMKLSFKPQLITELVKRGYDPEWGARPLARVIADTVETYLAERMLEGDFKQGDVIELGEEVFRE